MTIPDWLWVIFLFLALTIGYTSGFAFGSVKSESELNACPSESAYIRESEIMADANKEIEIRKAELEQQYALERYKIAAELSGKQNQTEPKNKQNKSETHV